MDINEIFYDLGNALIYINTLEEKNKGFMIIIGVLIAIIVFLTIKMNKKDNIQKQLPEPKEPICEDALEILANPNIRCYNPIPNQTQTQTQK